MVPVGRVIAFLGTSENRLAGSEAGNGLFDKSSSVKAVKPEKIPVGKVDNWLLFNSSIVKADSPENISAGRVVISLKYKWRSVSPVKPAKSPFFRLLPLRELKGLDPSKNNVLIPVNSAVVMSAQLVLPLTLSTITFLTTAVREQRSVGVAS